MGKSNSLPTSGHYNANYGNFQTELYAQIHREAFGEDIGQTVGSPQMSRTAFEVARPFPRKDAARCRLWSRRPGAANRRYHRVFRCGH
jgi:hypothetical protein